MKGVVFFLLLGFVLPSQAEIQTRIIGGSDEMQPKYQFTAKLLTNKSSGIFSCGSTFVASNWVVTAAHCVTSESGGYVTPNKLTVLSKCPNNSVLNENVCTKSYVKNFYTAMFNQRINDKDLAVLELYDPVPGIPVVTIRDTLPPVGTNLVALGWGVTAEGAPTGSDQLKKVTLPLINKTVCANTTGFVITDYMICAGDEQGGRDTCQGDSGGPLVQEENGKYILVGATSFGNGCARQGEYGVYTNIAKFANDIADITGITVESSGSGSGGGGSFSWFYLFTLMGLLFVVRRPRRAHLF